MEFARGDVCWGPAIHKGTGAYRPWVIVSDESHPFDSEECIALALPTQQHADGIPVPDDSWKAGGSETEAYISPWYVTTIKLDDFDRHQGTLEEDIVDRASAALDRYTHDDR